MADDKQIDRRRMLILVATLVGMTVFPSVVFAKDGDSGGDGGDGDSDSSGSGSSNSGSGSGDDGDDGDDGDNDDGDDSDNSGSGKGKNRGRDQDDARDALKDGKVIALSKAISIAKSEHPGRVIEAKLVKRGTGYDYRLKVITPTGSVKNITMDAMNGRIRGFLGL